MDALAPFVTDNVRQNPQPLPYLQHSDKYNFDIKLQVALKGEDMRESHVLSNSNFKVSTAQYVKAWRHGHQKYFRFACWNLSQKAKSETWHFF